MKRISLYPLKQRLAFLNSLSCRELKQRLPVKQYTVQSPLASSNHKIVKSEIMSFMPGGAFKSLKGIFKWTFHLMPKFAFPLLNRSDKETKLQVAITCILIGDFLNRVMGQDNILIGRVLPPKYLLLTADFFHIKGSVYGSSLQDSEISYNMSRIESDLAKFSLISHLGPHDETQLANLLQWKAAPYTYGYRSLYKLNKGSSYSSDGQAVGNTIGLVKTLEQFAYRHLWSFPMSDLSHTKIQIESRKLQLITKHLLHELRHLQFQQQSLVD